MIFASWAIRGGQQAESRRFPNDPDHMMPSLVKYVLAVDVVHGMGTLRDILIII
jgi:hypothetical protein